ncbi:MAG: hypothetical protein ABIH92_05755 [Nanoarchaeota archaeon]
MKIRFKKKSIKIPVKKVSNLRKFTGLMFKQPKTQNLLFEFNTRESKTIHSFFVFFSFLAIWLDEKNKVLDFHVVKPFTFAVRSKKEPRKLIEVPLNFKNEKIIRFFVDKRKGLNRY